MIIYLAQFSEEQTALLSQILSGMSQEQVQQLVEEYAAKKELAQGTVLQLLNSTIFLKGGHLKFLASKATTVVICRETTSFSTISLKLDPN